MHHQTFMVFVRRPVRPAAPIYERFTVQNFVLYHSEEIEVGQNMSKSWLLLRDVTNSDKVSTMAKDIQ